MHVVVGCGSTHNKLGLAPASFIIIIIIATINPPPKKNNVKQHDSGVSETAIFRLVEKCARRKVVVVEKQRCSVSDVEKWRHSSK